jgi:uncharacterized DUF497 family protein
MHTIESWFEFDPAKNAANLFKHGVAFAEAATCFQDQHALVIADAVEGEARWTLLGISDRGRLLTVVFTLRGERPRLISARKATARERGSHARRI